MVAFFGLVMTVAELLVRSGCDISHNAEHLINFLFRTRVIRRGSCSDLDCSFSIGFTMYFILSLSCCVLQFS